MSQSPPKPSIQASLFARWWPAAIVFLQFMVYSAIQAPVPAVNEPHYLGKAKHLWDPGWAAGDYFLDSSNPHLVFYLTVGWLTRLVSLEATAWIARGLGYGLLAVGWTMLARRIAGSRLAAVVAASIFLLLASIGNLSGEWLVGGIEGKVFSYAMLFAGAALWLDRRLIAAAACIGIAVSFHPVVGAWGIVCGAAAEVGQSAFRRLPARPTGHNHRAYALSLVVLFITALPGLIPALFALGGASPAEIARANYIQVFVRLAHHLDPTTFGIERYLGYAAMLIAWLMILFAFPSRDELTNQDSRHVRLSYDERWFLLFVLSSVAIAVAGVAIGWHEGSAWEMPLRNLRTTLLKFYPFRLADVLVPLALAMTVARLLTWRRSKGLTSPNTAAARHPLTPVPSPQGEGGQNHYAYFNAAIAAAVMIAAFAVSISIPLPSRNPSRMPPERLAGWINAARWIQESTPPDAVIVIPNRQWGFRWFSGRALYVAYKDAPQDTLGLLEWERRLDLSRRWWEASPTGFFSKGDLERLGEQTNADYLVTIASPLRFGAEPVYDNGTYRIYALH